MVPVLAINRDGRRPWRAADGEVVGVVGGGGPLNAAGA